MFMFCAYSKKYSFDNFAFFCDSPLITGGTVPFAFFLLTEVDLLRAPPFATPITPFVAITGVTANVTGPEVGVVKTGARFEVAGVVEDDTVAAAVGAVSEDEGVAVVGAEDVDGDVVVVADVVVVVVILVLVCGGGVLLSLLLLLCRD